MKRAPWSLAVLVWVVTQAAVASPRGDAVGNGAGLGESNFQTAYINLGSYIDLCLETGSCQLTEQELSWTRAIRAALPREYAVADQLRFLSESDYPGMFGSRVATTGNKIGNYIFINVDMLYQESPTGGFLVRIGIEQAAAILIHELGHHHGVTDHSALDRLGSKIASVLQSRVFRADLGPGRRNIEAQVVDLDRPDRFSQLVLLDGYQSFELSRAVASTIRCRDSAAGPEALQGFSLFNIHWITPVAGQTELELQGDLSLYCGSGATLEASRLSVIVGIVWDAEGGLRFREGEQEKVWIGQIQ